jgi:hypothetical protein
MTTKETQGGFGWAEPEMVYRQEEHAGLVLSTDIAAAQKAGVVKAPAGGAQVDMVMSRQLAMAVQVGLGNAWLALRAKTPLPARLRRGAV